MTTGYVLFVILVIVAILILPYSTNHNDEQEK